MIPVTLLNGSTIVVNVDHIQWIEHTPDTVISLLNGEKIIVRETPGELVGRVIEFKQAVLNVPIGRPAAGLESNGEEAA